MDDEVLGRGAHGQLQWVAGYPMDVRLHMVGLLQDEVQEKHYRVEERLHQVDKHKILQVGEHGLAERKKKPEPLLALKMWQKTPILCQPFSAGGEGVAVQKACEVTMLPVGTMEIQKPFF